MKKPLVSVVMSVRNGGRYLSAAIESVLSQSLEDFEFIVIDDASTDGSGEQCRNYARADSRMSVLANTTHLGLTKSLNRGLNAARGVYVARMDADDVSLPNRFERQVSHLSDRRDVGLLGSFYSEIDEDGSLRGPAIEFPLEPIVLAWRLAFHNPVGHPTIMARRSALTEVGGYDEQWSTTQDLDLYSRLARVTKLMNCPEVLLHRRRHRESVTQTRNRVQHETGVAISRKYVETVLGRSVPPAVIELLWRRQTKDIDEARQFVTTSVALCHRISSEPRWSTSERRLLRHYVSRKLLYELTPYINKSESWTQLVSVLRLDPSIVLESVSRRLVAKMPAAR